MARIRCLWVLLGLVLCTVSAYDSHVNADVIPSENECRPYIEKAIHELKNVDATAEESIENDASLEGTPDAATTSETDSIEDANANDGDSAAATDEDNKSVENDSTPSEEGQVGGENESSENTQEQEDDGDSKAASAEEEQADGDSQETGEAKDSVEQQPEDADGDSKENDSAEQPAGESDDGDDSKENDEKPEDGTQDDDDDNDSKEGDDSTQTDENQESAPAENESEQANDDDDGSNEDSKEQTDDAASVEQENKTAEDDDNDSKEAASDDNDDSKEATAAADDDGDDSKEASADDGDDDSKEQDAGSEQDGDSKEEEATTAETDNKDDDGDSQEDSQNDTKEEESVEETVRAKRSLPDEAGADQDDDDDAQSNETNEQNDDADSQETANESAQTDGDDAESQENANESQETETANESQENNESEAEDDEESAEQEESPEEDLTMEFEIPKNLRPHGHVGDLLGLDAESSIKENALQKTGDVILKDLKRIYDNAVKPLETMYKYRDLSNRHYGDPEIFSKPLVLFMGPWSGGKSTILNYLTDNEYTPHSIRSGAEPSPAYFNILMHGDEPEVLDGTQLAADWTFSGLQKFGQGLNDRLRGQKLPNKLLERVNIVEIPGILEVRKQVSRFFPFNDACQWFIDRADIIILVYDPSKLDAGPETEAILDQLKGREYQTRILLNKADQVKPEELLRVQGALIWNISPLMSSAQPPVMYTVSLWSHPYESGAPVRLLQAQERAFLTDLREAIDKRIENKIASARRFAVRIRNHAKMVDCYLTTYYNQKSLFSNKKQVSDKIIEHPQNYNIYEGLSTLTNISRYDLPDPEVYLDFFRLNPLYDFKKLTETCTYFKGCPINKLDIAIAYDLPELVGKYKKLFEQNLTTLRKEYDDNCNQTEPEPPMKIIKTR